MSRILEPQYGRLLDDFIVGEVYPHLWEVTLDDGLMALCAASFLDANPLYSSRRFACAMGFRDRIAHPMVLMNLALSSSVHDVSEQAIAHLAYINLQFPNAAYVGDTLSVMSKVLSVRASDSKPDRGVVHVRTIGVNQDDKVVVCFERKALIPVGRLENRGHQKTADSSPIAERFAAQEQSLSESDTLLPPELLSSNEKQSVWYGRPRGLIDDFEVGDIILHTNGRTIGDSEHMQLTMLTRNSHPLHFDAVYARERSFTGTRVVCGPLVFAWIHSLTSRDISANALWELRYDKGSHPAPVLAGDTLFAASRVIEKRDYDRSAGIVTLQLLGIKNEKPADLMKRGIDLFAGQFPQKVFEIEREILLPKQDLLQS